MAEVAAAPKALDILILGGTGFIGPHQVNYALGRGHRVTVFNRGRNKGMFEGRVEELIGNRDSKIDNGLEPLKGNRTWDVAIDNSGFVPRHVRDSAQLLKGRVGRYIYTSTVAVYDFGQGPSFPEDGPLAVPEDPDNEQVTATTYGPLKAECDRVVMEIFGDQQLTIVRPSYIVGPGDRSDRFTYWAHRIHKGGDVLAPSNPDNNIQWVDARDLCPWFIRLAEDDVPGIFNAAGPASPVSRAGLMWGIRATTSAPVRFHWPSDELLDELEIVPPMLGTGGPPLHFDNAASMAAGLTYRALSESALDTLAWWRSLPAERQAKPRRWITPEQEQEAIRRIAS